MRADDPVFDFPARFILPPSLARNSLGRKRRVPPKIKTPNAISEDEIELKKAPRAVFRLSEKR